VFCIYLRTNSDLCHLQHKLIGFYNRDEKCLQRHTNWVFKYSGLRFVFKMLNQTMPFFWTQAIFNICDSFIIIIIILKLQFASKGHPSNSTRVGLIISLLLEPNTNHVPSSTTKSPLTTQFHCTLYENDQQDATV